MPRHATLRSARRHPGGAAAVPRRSLDRRGELPQPTCATSAATQGISAITINAHSTEVASCTFDEQRRVLEIAQDEIGAQAADRQRHLGRRQPRSRAHRPHGGRRRRLGAAGVSAGAVHAAAVARDGARAFQAHRRRERPADHRVPVSARDRPGLSARHAAEDVRRRCRRSAPSRTGPATCRSTRCISARCRACRGR